MARFEYDAWSGVEAGRSESPYPRRSVSTTVCVAASAGATRCHITWVSG